MKIVLVSTYELGRQPFGLASPAAWLRRDGHEVCLADLSIDPLPALEVRAAALVAFHLPMHTATRLAGEALARVKRLNPRAHLCAFGLYAPLNESFLRGLGVETVLGGEFEPGLCALAGRLEAGEAPPRETPPVSLERLRFQVPDRRGLPGLARYPALRVNGSRRRVGYTEATRGCKHLCRHCPVVPVYEGTFRVVQPEVVLADIRQQVAAGAEHITFGDPDFFNGPAHAARLVRALHEEFPALTYDVTVKIEHLKRHAALLPLLKETGCLFVTSAVETLDDAVLARLRKGHTRADFIEVAQRFREVPLVLSPTFIPFTPWTSREDYLDLLRTIAGLELVDQVAPIQLALRLLAPAGSRLLELEDFQRLATEFDPAALVWRWRHPDPSVDELAAQVLRLVAREQKPGRSRREIFARIWDLAGAGALPPDFHLTARAAIPFLEEPWFC